jgi:hypothetical protein
VWTASASARRSPYRIFERSASGIDLSNLVSCPRPASAFIVNVFLPVGLKRFLPAPLFFEFGDTASMNFTVLALSAGPQ